MSTPLPTSESRWFRRFSLGYSAVCIALLAYFVIAWRGWFGVAPLSNPWKSLALMTFLATMGLTWVTLPRSPRWANVFGSASMIAFGMFVAAMMAG